MGNTGMFVFLLLAAVLVCVNCKTFTSIQRLTALAEMEDKLFKDFEVFLQKADRTGEIIPDAVIRFYNERKTDARLDSCLDMKHPIRAFYITHRIYNEWSTVIEALKSNNTIADQPCVADFLRTYNSMLTRLGFWPTLEDIAGLADNILRLWGVYGLKTKDIVNGRVASVETRSLKNSEVETIAQLAKSVKMDYQHLALLEELLNRTDDDSEKIYYRKKLSKEYYLAKTRKMPAAMYPSLAYTDFKRFREYNDFLKDAKKNFISQSDIDSFIVPPSLYEVLCRGPIKTKKEESTLRCFLRETAVPFYMAKEEVIHYEPRLSVFHDVISDDDIRYLKREATKKMSQATTGDGFVSRIRISQVSWLPDQAHPKLTKRLARRIANIVSLDTTFKSRASPVENWQVASYSTGGHYAPHVDPLMSDGFLWNITEEHQRNKAEWRQNQGQRIATWMFYLSDVDAGGATAFPHLKSRISVAKGAAAFWYNLLPNGSVDRRTEHGGCPVMLGSKWVSNKWIHESGQQLKRLCGKTYDSEDIYPDKYMSPRTL